ncbi:MAG: hypothetical protein AAGB05_15150 [Pseudomonadota bacterium]
MHFRSLTLASAALAFIAGTGIAATAYPPVEVTSAVATDTTQPAPASRSCTQLERSARISADQCGTLTLGAITKLKAEADQDGDGDS